MKTAAKLKLSKRRSEASKNICLLPKDATPAVKVIPAIKDTSAVKEIPAVKIQFDKTIGPKLDLGSEKKRI